MVIEVRLFAILRERAGSERLQLELDEDRPQAGGATTRRLHGQLGVG
jgi:molybdopterin converting factor small subunit